jgi:uncharacterized protein
VVRTLAAVAVVALVTILLPPGPRDPVPRDSSRQPLVMLEPLPVPQPEHSEVALEATSRAVATSRRLVAAPSLPTVARAQEPAQAAVGDPMDLPLLRVAPDPPDTPAYAVLPQPEAIEPEAIEPAALPPSPRAPRAAAAAPRLVPVPVPPAPGDEPTWLRHAAAVVARNGRPAVAVVIDDLGLNPRGTERIAALPGPLTMAFLPYGRELGAQSRLVRAAGHEVMAHVPMEPVGGEYPGPNALLTRLGAEENLERLRWGLDQIEGHVGVNNHMGSRFTADRQALAPVMAELRARGLLFLDSRTSPDSVAAAEARRHGVPTAARQVFLDNVLEAGAIREQLREVERVARATGAAIAIGHPHIATIRALEAWLPTLESRGMVLVPVSTLVAERACREGHVVACRALVAAGSRQLAAHEGEGD